MALDGPRTALWTFAGWALAAAGLVLVYMREFREALNLAGRTVAGPARAGRRRAGHRHRRRGLRLRRTGEERLAADRA